LEEQTQQQDISLMKQLLEAGVHFGHQTKRWNPKMERFIFGERNGIYIIDLQKTIESLKVACDFLREVASRGGYILFVGTKKQAQQIIKDEAIRCRAFYVTERWLGGTITNFQTIRKSINRLEEIEKMKQDGTFGALTKKEIAHLTKEMQKLLKNLAGIRAMERLPQAMYIVDSNVEATAVREANRLGIPVAGLLDTNCDPDKVEYVIPGNDDAIRSIKLITAFVVEAILEGRKKFLESKPIEEQQAIAEAEAKAEAAREAAAKAAAEAEAEAAVPTEIAVADSKLIEIAETEEEEGVEKEKEGKIIIKRKKKIVK